MGASLMHHQAIHKYLISAHASGSCTMLVGGLMGNVLACLDDPGRFYNRGNTRPNTDFSTKIPKSGRGGVLGWCQKVVGHMPRGALCGPPLVLGHEMVFRGRCGGFRAPAVKYMQYLQIHTYTYTYLHFILRHFWCNFLVIATHTCTY